MLECIMGQLNHTIKKITPEELTAYPEKFEGFRFVMQNLSEIDFTRGKSYKKIVFYNCNFNKAIFNGSVFKDVSFIHCDFHGAEFVRSHFQDCDFTQARFSENMFYLTTFNYCNFREAVFDKVGMKKILFNSCNMYVARFKPLSFTSCYFHNAKGAVQIVLDGPYYPPPLVFLNFCYIDKKVYQRGNSIDDGHSLNNIVEAAYKYLDERVAKDKELAEAVGDSLAAHSKANDLTE